MRREGIHPFPTGEVSRREHLGSIGSQLCFWMRRGKAAHQTEEENRLAECKAKWNQDLADLSGVGIQIVGWHLNT